MPRDVDVTGSHVPAPTAAQVAQATARAKSPIGRIEVVTGPATAQHVDGTVDVLETGAPVYSHDLIATRPGGKIAIVFVDKTTFALGESGQLRLDELVYNPAGKDGKMALSMLKGAFAFVTGDIAGNQAEAMTVRTPVGTIGIRGTAVAGNIDPTGGGTTIAAMPDPSGAPSIISFTNAGGTRVFAENSMISVQSFFAAPSTPFNTAGQNLGEAAGLTQVADAIAEIVNPGGSTSSGGAAAGSAGPLAASLLGTVASGPIHVTLSGGESPPTVQPINFLGPTLGLADNPQELVATALPPAPPSHPPQDHNPGSNGMTLPNQGTLGKDSFSELPHGANTLFDFTIVPNSLQSGDQVIGGTGNDTVRAGFDHPFTIDHTLTIDTVQRIELHLGGGPSSLDAAGISTSAILPDGSPDSTLVASGKGALTITNLQVNFDGSATTDPLAIGVAGSHLSIIGGAGNDTITATGDSLQSGLQIQAGGSASQLMATFSGSFTIDSSLQIKSVASIVFQVADDTFVTIDAAGIEAAARGTTITVQDFDVSFGISELDISNLKVNFDASGFSGDDVVSIDDSANVTVIGSAGLNTLQAGAGNDMLIGGSGTNAFPFGGPINLFITGSGNDTLIGGPSGNIYEITPDSGHIEIRPQLGDAFQFDGAQLGHFPIPGTAANVAPDMVVVDDLPNGITEVFVGLSDSGMSTVFLDGTFPVDFFEILPDEFGQNDLRLVGPTQGNDLVGNLQTTLYRGSDGGDNFYFPVDQSAGQSTLLQNDLIIGGLGFNMMKVDVQPLVADFFTGFEVQRVERITFQLLADSQNDFSSFFIDASHVVAAADGTTLSIADFSHGSFDFGNEIFLPANVTLDASGFGGDLQVDSGGDDTIYTGGNATVSSFGDDVIFGSAGALEVDDRFGDDTIYAAGSATVHGGGGDLVVGGNGTTDLIAGGDQETLLGGSGASILEVTTGAVSATGAARFEFVGFGGADAIIVDGAMATTAVGGASHFVSVGNGIDIAPGEVELGATANGRTPLYVGTLSGEVTIDLDGSFSADQLGVVHLKAGGVEIVAPTLGNQFAGTPGTDVFFGLDGGDTFTFANGTLGADDVVAGGIGPNVMNVTIDGASASGFTVVDVQTINFAVQSSSGIDVSHVQPDSIGGTLVDLTGNGTLALSGADTGMTIDASGFGGNLTLDFASGASVSVIGGTGTDTINLNDGTITLTGTGGIDTVDIGSTTLTGAIARLINPTPGDEISVPGGSFTGQAAAGNGIGLALGQVEVGTPSGGMTPVYLGAPSGTAEIDFVGSFAPTDFLVAGNHVIDRATTLVSTFTGTVGHDVVFGADGDDVFTFPLDTLDTGDRLYGGLGTNSLMASLDGASATPVQPVIVGFQTVTLDFADSSSTTINGSGIEPLAGSSTTLVLTDSGTASGTFVEIDALNVNLDAQGFGGSLSVSGGGANLMIWAGSGDDTIMGGSGDDTLVAGGGNELLDGNGTGAYGDHNTLQIALGGETDTVTLTQLDNTQDGVVAGTVTRSIGISDVIQHLDTIIAAPGSTLVIGGTALAVNKVDLSMLLVDYGTGAGHGTIAIQGFENVENLSSVAMQIIGDGSNNFLSAGSGGDTLTGNGGNDTFRINNVTDLTVTITDFIAADQIELGNLVGSAAPFGDQANGGGLGPDGPLSASRFVSDATPFTGALAAGINAAYDARLPVLVQDSTNTLFYIYSYDSGGVPDGYSAVAHLTAPITAASIHLHA